MWWHFYKLILHCILHISIKNVQLVAQKVDSVLPRTERESGLVYYIGCSYISRQCENNVWWVALKGQSPHEIKIYESFFFMDITVCIIVCTINDLTVHIIIFFNHVPLSLLKTNSWNNISSLMKCLLARGRDLSLTSNHSNNKPQSNNPINSWWTNSSPKASCLRSRFNGI